MTKTVNDVMTTRVVWVRKGASFKEMAERMRAHRVSAFPVLDDDGKVTGIVSEGDMLLKQALLDGSEGWPLVVTSMLHHGELRKAREATAGGLMTTPVVTITPDESVEHAAKLMYRNKVKRLPVVNSTGHLVGIVSRTDLLAVFDRPDSEIAAEITSDLILARHLMDPRRFKVTVNKGVVTLEGEPENASLGHEIVTEARHVQGVVAVQDRLSYPEPDTAPAPGFYVTPPR